MQNPAISRDGTLQIVQEGWLSPTERASVSAHFGLPWLRPCDNRGKCYMDGKIGFNAAGQTYSIISSTVYEL